MNVKLWLGGCLLLIQSLGFSAECPPPTASFFSKEMIASRDRVHELPGYGCLNHVELAGMLPVTLHATSQPSGLFYWFVESNRPDADTPIVLWLNGGPGASSLFGFFLENGPYAVQPDLMLKQRADTWTNQAHYWVIDQPAGVGLSLGGNGVFRNESEAMDQLYEALQGFYQRFPELLSQPLYIAGQSYAGKYIPELAMRIVNEKLSNKRLPLKGILIGDGWVNPQVQQSSDADFAYGHGLVDAHGREMVQSLYQACANEIAAHSPSSVLAHQLCGKMQDWIKEASGCKTLTNVATCKEPDGTAMTAYLNQPRVREALHVDTRVKPYDTFDTAVGDALTFGEQDSVASLYPQLLEKHIAVVLYNGLNDGTDSNFMGTDRWLSALSFPEKQHWQDTPTCIWRVKGHVAGYAREWSGLTQLKIRNAGHLAPFDKPAELLDMLGHVVHGKAFCAAEVLDSKHTP